MLPSIWQARDHHKLTITPPRRRSGTQRLLQLAFAAFLFLLAAFLLLLVLLYIIIPILIFLSPSLDIWFYSIGAYGVNPERSYRSFNLTTELTRSPRWNSDICELERSEGGLILIDVHGAGVTHSGPRITDLQGNLIWTDNSYGRHAMNVKVQEWKGEQYLTFWAGNGDLGEYIMLDSGFNHVKTVRPVGKDLWGDPHEFLITRDGTALMAIYNCTHDIDLSSTYMTDLTPSILDAIIQEVDLDTGELLWQWRASDHLGEGEYLKYTYDASPSHLWDRPHCLYGDKKADPADYFHMNSIDKDSEGNYLVSIRKTHQVVTISKDTGKILWGFGGRASDFTDLGDGHAGDFKWQHDARWMDEEAGILTLFDNGIAENYYNGNPYSAGRIIQLDIANRTATELHSYHSMGKIRSTSQGGFQVLSGTGGSQDRRNAGLTAGQRDQVFTGWGSAAAWSLHDLETEELLCETHYAPSLFFYWERTKTYRAIRAPKGLAFRPEKWNPHAVVDNGRVYVSWNGGMEVRSWTLRGRDDIDQWQDIMTVARDGFETSFDLPSGSEQRCSAYDIAALDAEGNILRYSNVFQRSDGDRGVPLWEVLLVGTAAVVVLCMVLAYVRETKSSKPSMLPRIWRSRRAVGYSKLESASEELDDLVTRSPETLHPG